MEIERDWSKAQAIRPSVSAVVVHDGRLLLMQRADSGQWGLPGGSVEIGETVTAAIQREVREETGYEIAVQRLIGVYSDPRLQIVRYPDGRVWHYVNLCFEGDLRGGEPRPAPGETVAVGWFAPDALPPNLVPLHRPRIEDAMAGLTGAVIR
ncbi:MAG: NUDIX domain-containing protein [Candidatus Rokubacteria bacterium]|nr:NUDIX domain-containing protein [Candidatus Rokubacteria bacterium]